MKLNLIKYDLFHLHRVWDRLIIDPKINFREIQPLDVKDNLGKLKNNVSKLNSVLTLANRLLDIDQALQGKFNMFKQN